jgi:hypothetical protein
MNAEAIADLLAPAPVACAPWIQPIGGYGVRRMTGSYDSTRFG